MTTPKHTQTNRYCDCPGQMTGKAPATDRVWSPSTTPRREQCLACGRIRRCNYTGRVRPVDGRFSPMLCTRCDGEGRIPFAPQHYGYYWCTDCNRTGEVTAMTDGRTPGLEKPFHVVTDLSGFVAGFDTREEADADAEKRNADAAKLDLKTHYQVQVNP